MGFSTKLQVKDQLNFTFLYIFGAGLRNPKMPDTGVIPRATAPPSASLSLPSITLEKF